MAVEVKRVVTGRTPEGKSVFSTEEAVAPTEVAMMAGSPMYLVWGTDEDPPTVATGDEAPDPVMLPFFPGPGGTRFVLVTFAPESEAPAEPGGDPEALAGEVEAKLPGLLAAMEPDAPGMHTTDSVDYGICVDGEMHLELDDGAEVRLTPGSCVVQRGTRHAWHNRSDKPATMAFVIVGANRK